MRVTSVVAAIVLPAIALPQAVSAQAEQRNLRGGHVSIYNLAGHLRAMPGTGDAVMVEITRRGADRDKLRIETGTVRDRETLRIVYPSDRIVYPALRTRTRVTMRVREDGTFSDEGWTRDSRDEIEIRDSGPGMDEPQRLTAFEPFTTHGNRTKGTGLGMSILKGFVEAMGGTVSAENRADGQPGLAIVIKLRRAA